MSRKFLITVILILFLLPFVSWYYLQSGLNWRKQAQIIMSGKEHFPEGEWIDLSGRKLSSGELTEHVTLVTILSCENLESVQGTLNAFYTQFKETRKANFIILNTCEDKSSSMVDSLKLSWYVFNCGNSSDLCQLLLRQWPEEKVHALIDRNNIIRSYYAEDTKEQKRILLEHMALLLPKERSDQIELKRGKEK